MKGRRQTGMGLAALGSEEMRTVTTGLICNRSETEGRRQKERVWRVRV